MSVDWVDILNREIEHLKESSHMLCEDNRRLRADNERLRGLLKAREFGGLFCPSCLGGKVSEARHYDDCPAFTPDGEVK